MDVVKKDYEKNTPRKKERQAKPSPLMGEGKGGGARTERHSKDTKETGYLPLTLTLSPKGRGGIIFYNTLPY